MAIIPVPPDNKPNWMKHHEWINGEAKKGVIDLIYVGELRSLSCNPDILLEFFVGDDPSSLTDDALFVNELLAPQRDEFPKQIPGFYKTPTPAS